VPDLGGGGGLLFLAHRALSPGARPGKPAYRPAARGAPLLEAATPRPASRGGAPASPGTPSQAGGRRGPLHSSARASGARFPGLVRGGARLAGQLAAAPLLALAAAAAAGALRSRCAAAGRRALRLQCAAGGSAALGGPGGRARRGQAPPGAARRLAPQAPRTARPRPRAPFAGGRRRVAGGEGAAPASLLAIACSGPARPAARAARLRSACSLGLRSPPWRRRSAARLLGRRGAAGRRELPHPVAASAQKNEEFESWSRGSRSATGWPEAVAPAALVRHEEGALLAGRPLVAQFRGRRQRARGRPDLGFEGLAGEPDPKEVLVRPVLPQGGAGCEVRQPRPAAGGRLPRRPESQPAVGGGLRPGERALPQGAEEGGARPAVGAGAPVAG